MENKTYAKKGQKLKVTMKRRELVFTGYLFEDLTDEIDILSLSDQKECAQANYKLPYHLINNIEIL